jgi:ribulose-5-phosphate 4-epimerase/fuculose-1-phosphate aldolase
VSGVEGVVRFRAEHVRDELDLHVCGAGVRRLAAWRSILSLLDLIGCDPDRYGGAGFGNLSTRLDGDRFLITGTQTGLRERLGPGDFCVVERIDLDANTVTSRGPVPPSSETMTHAAVYAGWSAAGAVIHGHSPEIWSRSQAMGLPATTAEASYGTPALAREVLALCREERVRRTGLVVLAGHEDGVVGIGRALEDAGLAILRCLARAGEAA